MSTESFDFDNRAGQRLSARLDFPVGPVRAVALFAHCFTCSKNLTAVRVISRALTDAGLAVLRFDFTGLGQSDGEFSNTNFSSNVEDLVDAADALRRRYQAPALMIGHSLGGAAVLRAAADVPGVVAVVTIGAPSEPRHVERLLEDAKPEILAQGHAVVRLGGRPFTIKRQFLDDLDGQRMAESISNLRMALLVMHGPLDEVVGIDNATSIFVAAKHPKSFVSLDRADHLLSQDEDAAYVGRTIAAWCDRYLPAVPEVPTDERWPALVEGPRRKYLTTMYIEGHTVVGDEPSAVGGSGLGPSPYGYLLGALGECTAMTLRMYADRKNIPLVRAEIRLRHGRVHAQDSEQLEGKRGTIDVIEREVRLRGDLSAEQRRRLLEIADRCPVHRTLTGQIVIKTREHAPGDEAWTPLRPEAEGEHV